MDKKSKIFLWVFLVLILVSISATYWRMVVKKDYIIEAQADCDPTIEKCFIYTCDPETETTCTGNPDDDVWYYQIVKRKAANVPLCDPADENCKALECEDGEKDCVISFCDEATKAEDEVCNDPEQYNLDNPTEEEAVECEQGDEECAPVSNDEPEEVTCSLEAEDCSTAVDATSDSAE